MAESTGLNLPPKTTLSSSTQNYIQLLERQLCILYPNENLDHSTQLHSDPLLKLVVGLIIQLSKQTDTPIESCSGLLLQWLHFAEAELPSLQDCQDMTHDREMLERLYRRGITDFFPPVMALKNSTPKHEKVSLLTGSVTFELKGELYRVISIETSSICKGRIATSYTINKHTEHSTKHHVQLIIDQPDYTPHNIDEVHSENGCVWHPDSRSRTFSVLILNARGTFNPYYVTQLQQQISERTPDIVVVTETRSPFLRSLQPEVPTQFDSSLVLEAPLNFFGGIWLLWKSSVLAVEPIIHRRQSMIADFRIINQ